MPKPIAAALFLAVLLAPSCRSTAEPATDGLIIRVVRLEHVDATEMADTLGRFAGEARSDDALKVVAHADTNSVVLSGKAERIRQTLDLIARLDVEAPK